MVRLRRPLAIALLASALASASVAHAKGLDKPELRSGWLEWLVALENSSSTLAEMIFGGFMGSRPDPDVLGPFGAPAPAPRADPVDGTLTRVPGTNPSGCPAQQGGAVHPGGRFVYAASQGNNAGAICAYAFNPFTLVFRPVPGTPFAAGAGSRALAIDPAGNYLYTADQDAGTTSGFAIDATTGALTPLSGSPWKAGETPYGVVVDPTGRFVYVASDAATSTGRPTVAGFALDRATGVLTPLAGSPWAAPPTVRALAIDPRGRFLYVGAGSIRSYAIDTGTGALTPIGADIATFARGAAVDPTGRYAYFATVGASGRLDAYRVGPTGALAAIGSAPVGSQPLGVAVSRSGRFVYVANLLEDTLSGFRIDDATGAVTPLPGSPFAAGHNPFAVATSGSLAIDQTAAAGAPFFLPLAIVGGQPPYLSRLADGALPPGLAVDATLNAIRGTPAQPGTSTFTLEVTDAAGASATRGYAFNVTGAVTGTLVDVVEYYHAGLDHYFITWRSDEIAALDAGTTIRGWVRTGQAFRAYATAQGGSSPICRYYLPPAYGDSHFFGRGTAECNATGTQHPQFTLEDPAFMHMALPAAGNCPAGTTPVYRVFSNRADANHRYLIDRALRDVMTARGWLAEGDGPDLVVMCAP